MYDDALRSNRKIFAVAPMMDWTDRHCRCFHRQLTRHSLLYTEMVVADAIIHGDVARHLDFDDSEHPIALQLGGSDPDKLARAAEIASGWHYDEINLNVGCPSDRVQSGTFGACLMKEPELVARCVAAMRGAVDIPVTVKCRLGVDDQDTETALDQMADAVLSQGCAALWVHARKAWLQGLSPKENRDVPPLDYDRVRRLKRKYASHFIGINGGIATLDEAVEFLDELDGVMLGRAAYQNPSLLREVDLRVYGDPSAPADPGRVCEEMQNYTDRHIAHGGRANHVTRHMIGLFQGQAGARRFRQILSVDACKPGATGSVITNAAAVMAGRDFLAAS